MKIMKKVTSRFCESPHSTRGAAGIRYDVWEGRTISKDNEAFDDCVILGRDAFDPDAVFLDDIVDDDVLPYLSLEVDGLTSPGESRHGELELRPDNSAANEPIPADTTLPVVSLSPEQLEVYGWESSLWKRIKGYLGI
jgi:hypothetical protein